jgi:hypothetical protein
MSNRSETQPKRQPNDDGDEKELTDSNDNNHWNERVDDFPSNRLETISEASSSSQIACMMQKDDDVTPTNNNNKNRNRLSSSGSSSSTAARNQQKKHRPSLLPDVDSKLLSSESACDDCPLASLGTATAATATAAAAYAEQPQIWGIPCRLFVILVVLSIAVLIGTILAVLSYKPPSER